MTVFNFAQTDMDPKGCEEAAAMFEQHQTHAKIRGQRLLVDKRPKFKLINVELMSRQVAAEAIDLARLGLERIRAARKGTSSSDESPSESESCSRGDNRGEESVSSADKPARVNLFFMEVSRI